MGTKKKLMYLSIKFDVSSIIENFKTLVVNNTKSITMPIILPGITIILDMRLLIRFPAWYIA
jgi:hypothetical protein